MGVLTYVALPIVISLVLIRKYKEYVWGWYNETSSLKGKVFLVTGANSGVGKQTARQLANRHGTVIMACRNMDAAEEAIQDIRKSTKNGELIPHKLDLASQDSIRKFAEQILNTYSKIDVLINNAGVTVPLEKNMRTAEGYELTFGVNHLGHFLLTELLTPKLIESAPSRIVIIASTLHEKGNLDFDDINLDKLRASGQKFRLSPSYCNSKLANVYHARELAERLKGQVDVRSLCPGFTYTNLFRNTDFKWYQVIPVLPIFFFAMRSAYQGSQTIVYCATEKNLPGKSGDMYKDVKLYQSNYKFDPAVQKQLWDFSLKCIQPSK